MEAVFLKVLNMSITASYLVFAVMVARLLIKKAPKFINIILWGFVAIRLVCPFSFESILSLIPSGETVSQDIIYSDTPQIHSGITILNSTINDNVMPQFYPDATNSVNPLQIITFIASVVWIAGIAIMVLYTVYSYLKIYFKVREAVRVDGNIYECDRVESPFILGVIKPRIYLPSNMSDCDREYVVAHERAHLKRCDHLWKPLGFLLLSVYWFNPILWVAYILLCRDIELACDQKVIKLMGENSKKSYSDALINCSAPGKMITACPVAFGETGVKSRIKSVLNYKKPTFWVIIVAVVLSVVVAVCFMTNPATKITDLKDDRIDYNTLFNNVEKIHAGMGDVEYYISYEDDIKEIKNQFKKIKIKETPISDNKSVMYDTTNWIMIGNYWLWFSEDFSQFGGSLAYTSYMPLPHKVSNPQAAKRLFELIKNSESNRVNTMLAATNIKTESHLKGVSISVKQILINSHTPLMNIEIKNESENRYMYGEDFRFYHKKNGKWTSCNTFKYSNKRTMWFNSVGNILDPYKINTKEYSLAQQDLSKKGKYRLETDDWWIEFELVNHADITEQPDNDLSIEKLKEKYPDYFALDTTDGIYIYVSEFAQGSYKCQLLSGRDDFHYPDSDIHTEIGATLEETKAILSSYNLSGDKLYVIPYRNMLSSYYYKIDDEYLENLKKLFGSTVTHDIYQPN